MSREWRDKYSERRADDRSLGEHHKSGEVTIPTNDAGVSFGTRYGDACMKGQSRAIFGNVSYNQYHYHSTHSQHISNSSQENAASNEARGPSHELSTTRFQLSPDVISGYNPRYACWLRSELRLPSTCDWLFALKEYKSWYSGDGPPILVCAGSVGCGKSILASKVIDTLDSRGADIQDIILSYFVEANQNQPIAVSDIVRALIKQVYAFHKQDRTPLPVELEQKLRTTFRAKAVPSPAREAQILCSYVALRPCTLIIDGLDALEEPEILAFIRVVRQIFDGASAMRSTCKLILFCRETLGRGIRFESIPKSTTLHIGLQHVRNDIYAYVDHEVSRRQQERAITNDAALLQEIRDVLKAHSAKMFLWVQLQVKSVWDPDLSTCDEDIRRQLKSLPEGLDEIYIRCLRKIESTNVKRSQNIAPCAFRWIACARRSLTYSEAQEIVSMEVNQLPFTKDKIIGLPLVDYCANLVVHNQLTGHIEFAHPTVKYLLQDAQKLPDDLKHFHVDSMEANLRCGDLCLSYIDLQRSKTSLKKAKKQNLDTEIVSSIFRTVSENSSSSWWPLANKLAAPKLKRGSVPLSLPAIEQHKPPAECAAHDYVFASWLWHTSDIHSAHPAYALFQEICLCHDENFQPWAAAQTKGQAHWERLVAHATMTNHVPLLQVAIDHFRRHKRLLDILKRPYPGTDSSFLHVAAALGHVEATRMLLTVCDQTIADEAGKSPAAIAIEGHCNDVFFTLLPEPCDFQSAVRRLKHFGGGRTCQENLLSIAAGAGNSTAIEHMFDSDEVLLDGTAFLSEALFQACRHGHKQVALLLQSVGADPNEFYMLQDVLPRHTATSLSQALHEEDASLMNMLLEVGAEPRRITEGRGIIQIVEHFRGREYAADPFIAILARHNGFVCGEIAARKEASWLHYMVERMFEDGLPRSRHWIRRMRTILDNSDTRPHNDFVRGLRHTLPCYPSSESLIPDGQSKSDSSRLRFEGCLQVLPDDILLRIISLDWFNPNFIRAPSSLRSLAERGTVRGLEMVMRQPWLQQHFKPIRRCQFSHLQITGANVQFDDLEFVRQAYVAPYMLYSDYNEQVVWKWKAVDLLDVHFRHHECLALDRRFCSLSRAVMDGALTQNHYWTAEYMACHSRPERGLLEEHASYHRDYTMNLESGRYTRVLEGIKQYEDRGYSSGLDVDIWIRCFIQTSTTSSPTDNAEAADQLYKLMRDNTSDANFALNWPAGYVQSPLNFSHRIHKAVLFGVYAWNYHLRRRKSKPFSKADVWYVGLKMVACYLEDHKRTASVSRFGVNPPLALTPTVLSGSILLP